MFCFMPLSAIFSLKMRIKFKSRGWLVGIIVFNVTFNNISAISWWLVLLVEETGVSRKWRKLEN